MLDLSLNIKSWAAWLPGVDSCPNWGQWNLQLGRQQRDAQPELNFVPALVRRRLSLVSKMSLNVAQRCLSNETIGSAVFCSRHGECQRTLGIFGSMAQGNTISPTQFSQSVHNTAAGVFSIERQITKNFCSIAAGPASGEQGFIEAFGLVKAGQGPVLWVMADSRLQRPYVDYCKVPEFPFALAMLVGEFGGSPSLRLQQVSQHYSETSPVDGSLMGTDNLLSLLTNQTQLALSRCNGWSWSWQHG